MKFLLAAALTFSAARAHAQDAAAPSPQETRLDQAIEHLKAFPVPDLAGGLRDAWENTKMRIAARQMREAAAQSAATAPSTFRVADAPLIFAAAETARPENLSPPPEQKPAPETAAQPAAAAPPQTKPQSAASSPSVEDMLGIKIMQHPPVPKPPPPSIVVETAKRLAAESKHAPPPILSKAAQQSRNPIDRVLVRYPEYIPVLQEAARIFQIDIRLLAAIIQRESDGNPHAVSVANAIGLVQFLTDEIAREHGCHDRKDFRQAILGGAHKIATELRVFGGDTARLLAGYNWGRGNMARLDAAHATNALGYLNPDTLTYLIDIQKRMALPCYALDAGVNPEGRAALERAYDKAMAAKKAAAKKKTPPAAGPKGAAIKLAASMRAPAHSPPRPKSPARSNMPRPG